MIQGLNASRMTPDTAPITSDRRQSRPPYSLARTRFPLPSSFPTMIPLPEPMPMQRQEIRFFTIPAMELAATASLPRWPIITVNMVKPQPQTSSLAITGEVYLTKSFRSTA